MKNFPFFPYAGGRQQGFSILQDLDYEVLKSSKLFIVNNYLLS